MKKILFMSIIGLGVIAFSGCSDTRCEPNGCSESKCTQNRVSEYGQKTIAQTPVVINLNKDCANTKVPEVEKKKEQLNQRSNCMPRNDLNICQQKNLFENNCAIVNKCGNYLEKNSKMRILVLGQGVSPMNTVSPAQAYALAKRAAVADAYRLIAEKVKGVYVEGEDLVQNMMVKRSTVRTSVNAMIRNANLVETTFKDGLCEVEMEITIAYSQFARY